MILVIIVLLLLLQVMVIMASIVAACAVLRLAVIAALFIPQPFASCFFVHKCKSSFTNKCVIKVQIR